jgi:hypothetical protein
VAELVAWLATGVVATIAGERLELARVAVRGPRAERWFLAALAALFAGATAATLWPDTGAHLVGAGVLAVVGWLGVFDVAAGVVDRPWVAVAGAAAVFAAVGWHLGWLAGRLRAALPARFTITGP